MGGLFDSDVAVVPGFVEEAGDVEGVGGIAEGEAVFVGVFQQPFAFAGFVEVGMEFDVGPSNDCGKLGGAEVYYGAKLMFAVAGWGAEVVDVYWFEPAPLVAGDDLGVVAAIAGDEGWF